MVADACGPVSTTEPINVRLCDPALDECGGGRTCQPATFGGWLPLGYYACL
jgi:hypothetical protein